MIQCHCAHCGTDLGMLAEGEPEPVCPYHPEGVVTAETVESEDDNP